MTGAQTGRLHDAAYNAVATASLHYQQSERALAHVLGKATEYGLTETELRDASGLPAELLGRLLEDA